MDSFVNRSAQAETVPARRSSQAPIRLKAKPKEHPSYALLGQMVISNIGSRSTREVRTDFFPSMCSMWLPFQFSQRQKYKTSSKSQTTPWSAGCSIFQNAWDLVLRILLAPILLLSSHHLLQQYCWTWGQYTLFLLPDQEQYWNTRYYIRSNNQWYTTLSTCAATTTIGMHS